MAGGASNMSHTQTDPPPTPVTDTKEGREMTDTSGAVYPGPVWTRDGHKSGYDSGMTKREYFAGQALAGMLAGGFADTIPHDDIEAGATATAFACMYADALIAALGGKDD